MKHIFVILVFIACWLSVLGGPIVSLKGILGTGSQEPALGNVRRDIAFIGYRLPFESEPIYRVLHDRTSGPRFSGPAILRKDSGPRFGSDIPTKPRVVIVHDGPQTEVSPSESQTIFFPGDTPGGKRLTQEGTLGGTEDSVRERIPGLETEAKDSRHPSSGKLLQGIVSGIEKDIFSESPHSARTPTEGIGVFSPEEFRRITRWFSTN